MAAGFGNRGSDETAGCRGNRPRHRHHIAAVAASGGTRGEVVVDGAVLGSWKQLCWMDPRAFVHLVAEAPVIAVVVR